MHDSETTPTSPAPTPATTSARTPTPRPTSTHQPIPAPTPTPPLNRDLIIVGTADPGVAGDVEMALAYASGMHFFSAKPLHLEYNLLFAVLYQAKCRLALAEAEAEAEAEAGEGWVGEDARTDAGADAVAGANDDAADGHPGHASITTTLAYTTTVYDTLSDLGDLGALAPLAPRAKPSYRTTTSLPPIYTVVPFVAQTVCLQHQHQQSKSESSLAV